MKYPYALTGGSIVLVAVLAAGAAFFVPFAQLTIEGNPGEIAVNEYHAMELRVTDGADEKPMAYRDAQFDDGTGITALRSGTWLLLGGAFLALCSALTLFAAPSSNLKTARVGAAMGLAAGVLLVAAVASYLLGYMDQVRAWADLDSDSFTLTSNGILAGTYFMGLGAVLSIGGGVLGFSDKAPVRTGSVAMPTCTCGTILAAGTRFCASCGTPVTP